MEALLLYVYSLDVNTVIQCNMKIVVYGSMKRVFKILMSLISASFQYGKASGLSQNRLSECHPLFKGKREPSFWSLLSCIVVHKFS